MQIAVCDDEKVYLDCLSRKIKACFKEFEIEISLDKYLNAVSFLEQHEQNPYDVVFLDILMPEMNGLDVANCCLPRKTQKVGNHGISRNKAG